MSTWNHAKKELFVKIVYYGPGLCGKTTNLEFLYAKTPEKQRGDKKTLNTETDRTLFFDYMPLDVGLVGGFKTKLQIFTVPGQVFYNQTRKLVLKGSDGVVFVADAQAACLELNKESLQNLRDNLMETEGAELEDMPLVFQWNKQDLPNLSTEQELNDALNPRGVPGIPGVAVTGVGVFETLREIVRLAIGKIRDQELVAPTTPSDVLGGRGCELSEDDL